MRDEPASRRGMRRTATHLCDCAQTARGPSSHIGARHRKAPMNLTLSIAPLVSLLAGILILVVPRLLNYIVAIYLIIIGLLGLFGAGSFHLK
jgi:hypothetical protein